MDGIKEQLVQLLIDVRAVEFGTFTLTSGCQSDIYIDIKRAITRPRVLDLCSECMAPYTDGMDRIAGVELGAIPLVTAISLKTGLPFIMVRKEPKIYGTMGMFDGDIKEGERILMVEDVTTTANSVIKGLKALCDVGIHVDIVTVVVDRGEGARRALEKVGVKLIPILTLDELRERALSQITD